MGRERPAPLAASAPRPRASKTNPNQSLFGAAPVHTGAVFLAPWSPRTDNIAAIQDHPEGRPIRAPDLNANIVLALALLAVGPAAWLARRATAPYAEPPAPPARLPIAIALAGVFAWAALTAPPGWILALSLGLGWTLVCLAAIDLTSFRLPDPFTLPLLAAGLAVSAGLPGRPILDHLAGAAVAWGALTALASVYRRWRGVDGLGLGDAKLLGAAGAWLGWRSLPSVVLIACGVALAWVGLQAIMRGRVALSDRLAFGAPLCLAFWIVWLHGPLSI